MLRLLLSIIVELTAAALTVTVVVVGGFVLALAAVVCGLDCVFPWGRYPCGLGERVQAWRHSATPTTRLTGEER